VRTASDAVFLVRAAHPTVQP